MPSFRVLDVINAFKLFILLDGLNTLSRLKWGTSHHLWSFVIITGTLPFQHAQKPSIMCVYYRFSNIKQLLKFLLSVELKVCHHLGPLYEHLGGFLSCSRVPWWYFVSVLAPPTTPKAL